MRAFMLAALTAAIALSGCNNKQLRPGYCSTTKDCTGNLVCDMGSGHSWTCVEAGVTDGPADAADGGGSDASEAGDASDAAVDVPFRCTTSTECMGRDGGAGNVCEPDAGTCVECLPTMKDACSGMKPVCAGTTCVPCSKDTDCTGPGVCMTDGHCASDSEVIYVEFKSAGCVNATGSSTNPFCAPNEGVMALDSTSGRRVIVIRGPVSDRMVLNRSDVAVVVIGRQSAGTDPSIPAVASTALTVSAGEVLIRDISLIAGTSPSSKGLVVSGTATKVSLVNVTVSLTTGFGIQADNGADLTMDRCYVLNNSAGGLLINGAIYSIENSVFAGNGFSQVQFSAAANAGTPRFRFNTVVATTGNAATCDPSNLRTLSDSIIVGGANCMLVNVVTTTQNFKTTPPYHLMGHVECPGALSMVPAYDIDGDPRVPPIDCGADQFVVVP